MTSAQARGPRHRNRAGAQGARGRAPLALLIFLVLLGWAAWGGYGWLRHQYFAPGPPHPPVRIQVAQGASVRGTLGRLEAQGLVRHATAVRLYLRLAGLRPRIQIGTYEIPPGASPAEIVSMFDQGRVLLQQLTIVEGTTFAELRRALDRDPYVTHILRGKSDAEVMTAIGHEGEFPEGRFFPDTYRFAEKTSDAQILTIAYDAMQRALQSAWQTRSANLPFDTAYQALTLASIIEKETALPAERPRIAGVFVSRLRKGMRLQSDPTVIYGLGAGYDGDIHSRDLTADTAYNTYTRSGLPPTPISLPGRESLIAAVHPLESGELYFVATGSGDGGHHFSRTLEEHNAAVKSYLEHLRTHPRQAGTAAASMTAGSHP